MLAAGLLILHPAGTRCMSTPVHEEQRLGNRSASEWYNARLPLQVPRLPASTQGLYLCTNGDALLGRADNGASCAA